MSAETQSWYVVHDGRDEETTVEDWSTNPVAFDDERDARTTFNESISQGLVTENDGLFLVRVDNVPEEDEETFLDVAKLEELIKSGFGDYDTAMVDKYATSLNNWSEESRSDDGSVPEGAVETEDGWTFTEENADPFGE